MIILKVTKKQVFALSLEGTFLEPTYPYNRLRVNFEHISHLFLGFLLLNLKK